MDMERFEIEELTFEELAALPELVATLENGCGKAFICGSCGGGDLWT
jgi:hypothetical protein